MENSWLDRNSSPGPSAYTADTVPTKLLSHTGKYLSTRHQIPVPAYIHIIAIHFRGAEVEAYTFSTLDCD